MLSTLGIAGLLGSLALIGRAMGGNWLVPAAVFPLVWAVLMSIAGALQGRFPLQPEGLWVIVSLIFSFQAGALAVHYAARGPQVSAPSPGVDDMLREGLKVRLVRATALTSLLAAIGVAGLLVIGVTTFGVGLSLAGIVRLGNLFSVLRYAGVGDLPVAVRAFLYWTYPAALLGGMLTAVAGTRPLRLLGTLPLLVALAGGLVVASRGGLLLALFMWTAGFWAVQICVSRGTYNPVGAGRVIGFAALVLLLIGFSVGIRWLRSGVWRRFAFDAFAGDAIETFFGSISAFTTWFAVAPPTELALGAFTFAGPFDFFGLTPRIQGLYQVSVYFPAGTESNIYTAFRGLIQDFGLVGAWGACFVGGVLSSLAYRRCAAGRVHWAVPLSAFYAVVFFSHLFSVFIFNSVILGWVVAAVVAVWPVRWFTPEPGPEEMGRPPEVRGLA